jgi:hypothetical protein
MASKSWYCFRGTTCYHVNFLASTLVPNDDATTSPPPECRLFFTEFWTNADDGFESSKKPPVCCPIQDYHAFPGKPTIDPLFAAMMITVELHQQRCKGIYSQVMIID